MEPYSPDSAYTARIYTISFFICYARELVFLCTMTKQSTHQHTCPRKEALCFYLSMCSMRMPTALL